MLCSLMLQILLLSQFYWPIVRFSVVGSMLDSTRIQRIRQLVQNQPQTHRRYNFKYPCSSNIDIKTSTESLSKNPGGQ